MRQEAIKLAEKASHGNDKMAKAQELKMKINDLEESITADGVSFLQVDDLDILCSKMNISLSFVQNTLNQTLHKIYSHIGEGEKK